MSNVEKCVLIPFDQYQRLLKGEIAINTQKGSGNLEREKVGRSKDTEGKEPLSKEEQVKKRPPPPGEPMDIGEEEEIILPEENSTTLNWKEHWQPLT